MVCCLVSANYLNQCYYTLGNKLQWHFNRNFNIFIQENAFEDVVCEMPAILSRIQCVNVMGVCNILSCSEVQTWNTLQLHKTASAEGEANSRFTWNYLETHKYILLVTHEYCLSSSVIVRLQRPRNQSLLRAILLSYITLNFICRIAIDKWYRVRSKRITSGQDE